MALKDTELDLWNRYKAGDTSAKKELMSSITPIIRSQANKFKAAPIPFVAIELEGYRLASHAIDTYEPDKAQLNTHLINNLKKLSRFVTNYQNVGHIPEPRALMIGKYHTINSNLTESLGREPTIYEISDAMQVSPMEIERLQLELRKDLSMEMPSADPDAGGFYSYVRDDEPDPRKKQIYDFVYFDMDPVNKKIMEYLFGMYGTSVRTKPEIIQLLRISEEEFNKRGKEIAAELNKLL
ncbi:MAG TPA: sigma-70 domain-containing protein [Bacteroidales bacterium]|nr:sigma-70 domain-containing protein [Bacteroidales bacterium]